MSNDIAIRETTETLFQVKLRCLEAIQRMKDVNSSCKYAFESFGGYEPWRLEFRYENCGKDAEEKYVDRMIWRHLVKIYMLEKYMLCTEFKKMTDEVEGFRTPRFTVENADGWINGLKSMIYENVRLMCKKVYEELITGKYRTGGGYNGVQKKRNNNGVDSMFILTNYDYNRVFSYYDRPTITDDLEKVCYILDGKTLPERTLISEARGKQDGSVGNEYFSIIMYKNGNTHYKLTEETRRRLNMIGPDGNMIGESVKIKIVPRG